MRCSALLLQSPRLVAAVAESLGRSAAMSASRKSVLKHFAVRIWWFSFCAAAGALVYLLSAGPALALAKKGYISKSAVRSVYQPAAWIEHHCAGDIYWRYLNWWAPWTP